MKLPRRLLEEIERHGKEGYPFEVCGVLLGPPGEARITRVVKTRNCEVEQPRVRYVIAPEDLLSVFKEADKSGLEVKGYYHTHPDHPPRPSETDRRIAAGGLSDGVFHLVVSIENGTQAHVDTGWIFRDALQAFELEPLDLE